MSLNLTTALILLAILVLAGVGLQGLWRARRVAAKRAAAAPLAEDADACREPSMSGLATPQPEIGMPETAGVRPDGRPVRRTARLDALIDAIATLTVDAPVSGEAALAHLPGSNRAGTKPFYIEGLNA